MRINKEQLVEIRDRIAGSQKKIKNTQSKYKSKQVIVDGIKFPSQLEANEYKKLKLLKSTGDIEWFTRQVPFYLPGGIKYVADFLVCWKGGKTELIETKGFMTYASKIKLKQMQELYPELSIKIVKA